MPRRLAVLLPALVALIAAPPAGADHIAGATYNGPAAGGGTVSFDVSADGSAITRFAVTDVATTCGTITSSTTGTIAIVNHTFSYTPSLNLRFSGSFPAPQQAQGTLSLKSPYPSCTSADVGWTATTTAQPPPPAAQCADGTDNDGDGKIDFPADPGCSSATDNDETDPAPPPDSTPPVVMLGGATSQRVGSAGVLVKAGCPAEACTVVAGGSVAIKGAKGYKLRKVTKQLAQGATVSLRLKLSAAALRAVRKALAKSRRVTARIVLTATDAAGNKTVKRRTIRLRR